MRRLLLAAFLLVSFFATNSLFAQTGNGSVGGIVQDSTKALIPGVTITITNTATAVTSTQITNETGSYTFPSVPPGNYKLTAELSGFKASVANDLRVGPNAQVRWDFTMEVGTVDTKVEVSVATDQVQTESTASVGLVLPENKVRELPIVGQNVLDLINVLPGFRQGPNGSQASGYTVGGLGLDVVNTTINGLSTNSARDSASFWGYQTMTTNVINPDMIGEVRLIIAPVDAELGRGNAQFQLQTRSGANRFAGAAVINARNSALDANTWANNKINARPNWYNLQQYTFSVGGPIQKNKTFFFFLYDQQENHARELISNQIWTDTARQGIFRYWTGWNPADALAPFPTSFTNSPTGTYRSVDLQGKPLAPLQNPDGSSAIAGGRYTGNLVCFSVFGRIKYDGSPFTQSDCPGGTDANGNAYSGLAVFPSTGQTWDPLRAQADKTGYISKVLGVMPHANLFANFGGVSPDGLNTAIYRYLRHRTGSNSTNASIGVANAGPIDYPNRKQENLKIDHNFNSKHRISFQWTYERSSNDGGLAAWDGKLNGLIRRRPELLTVNGTSTLTPNLVNEARFGVNYSSEWAVAAWDNIDHPDITQAAQAWLLTGGKNATNNKTYPVIYNPGANSNGYLNFTSFDFANTTPLWDYADTVRWSHGKHALSVGGEFRRPMTTGFNSSGYPSATTGNPAQAAAVAITQTGTFPELPGFQTTARTNTGTLLYFLNGSLATASTSYWIDSYADIKNQTWRDTTTEKDIIPTAETIYGHQTRTQISNEWSFFVKDDFKMSRRLTLNLGVRYDYNMSPYLRGGGIDGLTNRFVGDGLGLFGAGRPKSGNIFDGWLQPGSLYLTGYGSNATTPLSCQNGVQQPNLPVSTCDPNLMSTSLFVGPGSPNPDKTLVPQSGRFGPAIGAAWSVPWFGDGKTVVRGGFQRTYGIAGSQFSGGLVSGPAADGTQGTLQLTDPAIAAIVATRALNLSDLPTLVPGRPARNPGQTLPITGRFASQSTGYGLYAPDFVTPYTDNFTLSISRTLRRDLTVDVRLVDTLGKRLPGTMGGGVGAPGSFDINTVNVYHNTELLNALNATRAGLDDPLFDQMLMGLNLNPGVAGFGAVGSTNSNGVVQRGSAQLRKSATFASNLANGNYVAVVNSLITFAPSATNLIQSLPIDPTTGTTPTTSQRLLRNGCDRLANGLTQGFTVGSQTINPRCFPENYFVANPQLASGAAIYAGNFGHTNYQSFETQVRWRASNDINLDATYSFSKTMQLPGNGYTDPLNRELDYGKAPSSVGQELRANGIIGLPVGPNKLLLKNSHGWLARAVEHWQTGFILNLPHGYSRSLGTAQNFLYGNGRPDVVGPWDNPKGQVTWSGDNGYFFGTDSPYVPFKDPQCTNNVTAKDALGTNLQTSCTLQALGKVVPQGTAGAVALPDGKTFVLPVLQNPQPGHQGTLGSYTMYTISRWNLDANMSKSFQIGESKSLTFRIDCTNVLNHPWPADPIGLGTVGQPGGTASNFSANNFGQIVTKGGTNNGFPRQFQAKLRFSF